MYQQHRLTAFAASLMALALAGCGPAPAPSSDPQATSGPAQTATDISATIQPMTEAWQEAWNRGDAATIAALYGPEATLMVPGAELATGAAEIRATLEAEVAGKGDSRLQIESGGTEAYGVIAVETGSYVMTGGDGAHLDHGKFLAVWKQQAGEWKLYRDIWNSSMAPAPAAPPESAPAEAGTETAEAGTE